MELKRAIVLLVIALCLIVASIEAKGKASKKSKAKRSKAVIASIPTPAFDCNGRGCFANAQCACYPGFENPFCRYCSNSVERVMREASGNITDHVGSGPYRPNTSCQWLISPAPLAKSITLIFKDVDTEQNYDKITVYDGYNENAPVLKTISGKNPKVPPITSSSGSLFISFSSDSGNNGLGFNATYISHQCSECFNDGFCSNGVCNCLANYQGSTCAQCLGERVLYESIGNFSSNVPSREYINNQDCKWLIEPKGAVSITLNITRLDTEHNYDKVTIYDGATINSPIIATVSGATLPETPFVSTRGIMLVRFTSDSQTVGTGFTATYEIETCSNSTCVGNGQCSEGFCSCYHGYAGNRCNYCNSREISTLLATNGTIQNPTDAPSYQNNANCNWIISPPNADHIMLIPRFLSTESYDKVKVYDGLTQNAPLLATWYGNTLPEPINSTSNSVLVQFTSDSSGTDKGFKLDYVAGSCNFDCWQQGCCTNKTNGQCACFPGFGNQNCRYCSGDRILRGVTGSFSDHAGGDNYLPNTNCQWTLLPEVRSLIQLTFTRFETEANDDVVKVYDGPTQSYPLIGTYSGSTTPQPVKSTGDALFIVFTSDSSNQYTGFAAKYKLITPQKDKKNNKEDNKKQVVIN